MVVINSDEDIIIAGIAGLGYYCTGSYTTFIVTEKSVLLPSSLLLLYEGTVVTDNSLLLTTLKDGCLLEGTYVRT